MKIYEQFEVIFAIGFAISEKRLSVLEAGSEG